MRLITNLNFSDGSYSNRKTSISNPEKGGVWVKKVGSGKIQEKPSSCLTVMVSLQRTAEIYVACRGIKGLGRN